MINTQEENAQLEKALGRDSSFHYDSPSATDYKIYFILNGKQDCIYQIMSFRVNEYGGSINGSLEYILFGHKESENDLLKEKYLYKTVDILLKGATETGVVTELLFKNVTFDNWQLSLDMDSLITKCIIRFKSL